MKTPAEVGDVELTALCYHMDDFLFTGTNRGHVCTWDVRTQRCLMTWEADEGEIGTNRQNPPCVHDSVTFHHTGKKHNSITSAA